MNLILFGPPGCGKGTHSEEIVKRFSIPAISTGNLFRKHLKEKTPLGQLADSYISAGKLVPDDVTAHMVKDRLEQEDAKNGFVLDGFPRTVPQAEALDTILTNLGRKIDAVVYLQVPDEEIIKRLSGRRFCPTCQNTYHILFNKPKKDGICDLDGTPLIIRKDDCEETIRERLNVYAKQTSPVVDFYNKRGVVYTVDGNEELPAVRGRIKQVLDTIVAKK